MSAQHTPGPWDESAQELEGSDSVGLCVIAGDEIVCSLFDHMGSHFHNYTNDKADARLIAAAPDMLAVLQRLSHATRDGSLRERTDELNAIFADARAAITKATGAQ